MPFTVEQIDIIKAAAINLDDYAYDQLLEKIGDAQIILLGEATHGTHEFYEIRAHITKRLIEEKHIHAIAIEGDWPDAYQINKYIHGSEFSSARQALQTFDRFPTWMWANVPMLQFVQWLKEYNDANEHTVSFYGLDLYSLYKSIDVIIAYLATINPDLAQKAREKYACVEQYRQNPEMYGYAVFSELSPSCQEEVVQELKRIQQLETQLLQNKQEQPDAAFSIIQNARVVKNAESYYRSLFIDEVNNWNLRDSHMMETVQEILQYYRNQGIAKPKVVIWAHNSHIGNSAATQMSTYGEFNIGQLAKEKYGSNAYNLGFTTYNGTVSAASDWHKPVERKIIRDAVPNSYENLFHQVGLSQFLLPLQDKNIVPERLLERAIGVIYLPQTERQSHYFYASLAYQFDAIIHCDTTTAIEPLEKTSRWIDGEVPEGYPTGL